MEFQEPRQTHKADKSSYSEYIFSHKKLRLETLIKNCKTNSVAVKDFSNAVALMANDPSCAKKGLKGKKEFVLLLEMCSQERMYEAIWKQCKSVGYTDEETIAILGHLTHFKCKRKESQTSGNHYSTCLIGNPHLLKKLPIQGHAVEPLSMKSNCEANPTSAESKSVPIPKCASLDNEKLFLVQEIVSEPVKELSYEYCLCKTDKGGKMVHCDSGNCTFGQWFHCSGRKPCVMFRSKNYKGDWICDGCNMLRNQSIDISKIRNADTDEIGEDIKKELAERQETNSDIESHSPILSNWDQEVPKLDKKTTETRAKNLPCSGSKSDYPRVSKHDRSGVSSDNSDWESESLPDIVDLPIMTAEEICDIRNINSNILQTRLASDFEFSVSPKEWTRIWNDETQTLDTKQYPQLINRQFQILGIPCSFYSRGYRLQKKNNAEYGFLAIDGYCRHAREQFSYQREKSNLNKKMKSAETLENLKTKLAEMKSRMPTNPQSSESLESVMQNAGLTIEKAINAIREITPTENICTVKFKIKVMPIIPNTDVTFKIKTSGQFCAFQTTECGRPVSGIDRVEVKTALEHMKPHKLFTDSQSNISDQRFLHKNNLAQGESVLSKAKSEKKCQDRFGSGDLIKDVKEAAAMLKADHRFQHPAHLDCDGYLQRYNYIPEAYLMYCAPQIKYMAKSNVFFLDSTGQIIPKQNGKELLLHSLLAKVDSRISALPVCEFISEKGSTVDVLNMFNVLIQSIKKVTTNFVPQLIVTDMNLPYLHAINQSFNVMPLHEYINLCFNCMKNNKDFPKNKTTLFVCSSHVMHAASINFNKKTKDKYTKNIGLHAMARLIETRDFSEFKDNLESIIEIFSNPHLNEKTANALAKQLCCRPLNYDEDTYIRNVKLTLKTEDEIDTMIDFEIPLLEREKSAYFVYFEKKYQDLETRRQKCNTNCSNRYFDPSLLNALRWWITYFPLISRCKPFSTELWPDGSITNGCVEQYFSKHKNIYHPKRQYLPEYIIKHADVVHGMLNNCLRKLSTTKRHKAFKNIVCSTRRRNSRYSKTDRTSQEWAKTRWSKQRKRLTSLYLRPRISTVLPSDRPEVIPKLGIPSQRPSILSRRKQNLKEQVKENLNNQDHTIKLSDTKKTHNRLKRLKQNASTKPLKNYPEVEIIDLDSCEEFNHVQMFQTENIWDDKLKDIGTLFTVKQFSGNEAGLRPLIERRWLDDNIFGAYALCLIQDLKESSDLNPFESEEFDKVHKYVEPQVVLKMVIPGNPPDYVWKSFPNLLPKLSEVDLNNGILYIPAFLNHHIFLSVVKFATRSIEYYDTKPGYYSALERSTYFDYIKDALCERYKINNFTVQYVPSRYQLDGTECGILALETLEKVLQGCDPIEISPENTMKYRGAMLISLLNTEKRGKDLIYQFMVPEEMMEFLLKRERFQKIVSSRNNKVEVLNELLETKSRSKNASAVDKTRLAIKINETTTLIENATTILKQACENKSFDVLLDYPNLHHNGGSMNSPTENVDFTLK